MEWEELGEKRYRFGDRVRCITDRLGSSMLTPQDQGPLVKRRGSNAYNLSGVVISNSGFEDICQEQIRNISFAKDGQHHDCGVHQQPGGYCHSFNQRIESHKKMMIQVLLYEVL